MTRKLLLPLLSVCLTLLIASCKKESQPTPTGPIKATDVSAGADGSVFIVGADSLSTGGYPVSKIVDGKLTKLPDCAAVRIAVSPQGTPWVVTKTHTILKYNGSSWDQVPGSATDIGIGGDGSVFIIGTQFATITGGNVIMKLNGANWTLMPDCAGVHIAVDPQGTPWVVNLSNIVFQYGGTYLWNIMYGVNGNDIGIGADGSVVVSGSDANAHIYRYLGSGWSIIPGISGSSLSVSPEGSVWWIDSSNLLHHSE